jgi:hypothetical protein
MREGVPATQGYLVLIGTDMVYGRPTHAYLEGKHRPREKPNGSQR